MVRKTQYDRDMVYIENRLDSQTNRHWELFRKYERLMSFLELEEVTQEAFTYIRSRLATKQKQETKGVKNG